MIWVVCSETTSYIFITPKHYRQLGRLGWVFHEKWLFHKRIMYRNMQADFYSFQFISYRKPLYRRQSTNAIAFRQIYLTEHVSIRQPCSDGQGHHAFIATRFLRTYCHVYRVATKAPLTRVYSGILKISRSSSPVRIGKPWERWRSMESMKYSTGS